MPKAWVTDLWTKTAIINGQRTTPTPAQLRKLRTLPEHFRTSRFGKGNRWRVSWDDPDGTRRTKSYSTKQAADEFAASMDEDIRVGRYINPADTNRVFGDVARAWLESKRRLKGATIWRYQRDLDRWVLPRWEHTPIGRITRTDIDKWVNDLMSGTAPLSENAVRQNRGGLAPKSVTGIVGIAFGAPLRWAVEQGWLTKSPLHGVEMPADYYREEITTLSYREIEELALAVKTVPNPKRADKETDGVIAYTLVQFLAFTGLRINEALALDWRDVDLRKRRARVRRTWTLDRDGRRVIGPPKTWENRTVPIPEHVVTLLQNIRGDGQGWVFKSARGEAINDKNWRNRVWAPALRNIGLEGFTIHGLRHTAVSNAIAAGADVKLVQLLCGHKSATITLDVYGHLWPDRLDQVIDAVSLQRERALSATDTEPILGGES